LKEQERELSAEDTGSLKLKYEFIPNVNPIRASAAGANPNFIDLQVRISNPHTFPITIKKVSLEIPVGHESARDLSGISDLPSPSGVSEGWAASSAGGTISVTPENGDSGIVGINAITFTLKGIQINETPSAGVPITITEFYPDLPKALDPNSYSLAKEDADFPITNFYAKPNILFNQHESTTLFWECSDEGKNYTYGLHCDDIEWQDADCLGQGNCFKFEDGSVGVQTPALSSPLGSALFTFYLDVVKTDSEGNRSLYATFAPLKTTVKLSVPSVSGNSKMTVYLSGRVVRLQWLAFNASKCTVELDGNVIVDDAPLDTYEDGYIIVMDGRGGSQLAVTAHALSGSAVYTFAFYPNIRNINPIQNLSVASAQDLAITPDSKLALVVDVNNNQVNLIDVATLTMQPAISTGPNPFYIAITPDGTLALLLDWADSSISVIDLSTRTLEPGRIHISMPIGIEFRPNLPFEIGITPDSKLALVTNLVPPAISVSVIDIAARSVEPANISLPPSENNAIAVTPDGALAFVCSGEDYVSVIDIAARTAEPATLSVGGETKAIAITPDGKLALVCSMGDYVSVIDIASRKVEAARISVGGQSGAIAITSDSAMALVADRNGNRVTVVDIIRRQALTPTLGPVVFGASRIAVTPDGTRAFLINFYGNDITVL
jgi:DNA-binding beta-propeller fold protein YncE